MTRWVCISCWTEDRGGFPDECPACRRRKGIWWTTKHDRDPRPLAHVYLDEKLEPASEAIH